MKALYFDTFAGLSGDKTVGAMVDLGWPVDHLRSELAKLALPGLEVEARRVHVGAIAATKFEVGWSDSGERRTLGSIKGMLAASALSAPVKERAIRIFETLARAEGRVHGVSPEQVHFHEVGAVDSIADIVGACAGLEALGVKRVFVGALPLGTGMVDTSHGPLPVPAPGTVELLRGLPALFGSGQGELVTPTGAALLTGFGAEPVSALRLFIERVGYGAGTRQLEDRPNALRLVLGDLAEPPEADDCQVIEANLDDLNPEFYDYVGKRLWEAGALDVSLLPLQMKKGRPGTLLSVVSPTRLSGVLGQIILEETSTLGLRIHGVSRMTLARRAVSVETSYGGVRVKVATRPSGRETVAPEYEDCARAAEAAGVPIGEVYDAAAAAAMIALSRGK